MPQNIKNISDLREVLFEAIEGVRTGKIDSRDALVIAKLSDSIISSADVEIRYNQSLLNARKAGVEIAASGNMPLVELPKNDDSKKPDEEIAPLSEKKDKKQSGKFIVRNDIQAKNIPEIIKLYKREDMDVQDIADMYGVSVGQVNECIQKNLEKY